MAGRLEDGASARLPLGDRVVAILSMRGPVGITQDELLPRLGSPGAS